MEVCRSLVRYKTNDVFRLYGLGDIHGGTVHCAEDKAKHILTDIVEDPFSLWLDMGDSVECITPSDKRWQQKIIADWLKDHQDNISEVSRDWYCDLVKKAVEARTPHDNSSRCKGKIKGNHEWELQHHNVANIQANICNRLGIPDLGFSCLFHLVFQRLNSNEKHMFRFHLTHGSGNAQTPGGRTQKLKKIMNQTDAIYTIVAHMHDIKIEVSPILVSGNSLELKAKHRIGAISGTFLRTYTQGVEAGYGERKNYDPTSMGCVVFEINPGEEIVTAKPVYV